MENVWNLLAKVLVASAAMGIFCWWTNSWIEGWIGVDGVIARLAGVFVPIGVGIATLVGACKLLKVQELDWLIDAILRR